MAKRHTQKAGIVYKVGGRKRTVTFPIQRSGRSDGWGGSSRRKS